MFLTATSRKWMHCVKGFVWFSDCPNWISLFLSACLIIHEHLICTFVSGRPIKISMSSVSCGSIDGSNIPQSLRYESSSPIKYMHAHTSVHTQCTQTRARNDVHVNTHTHAHAHAPMHRNTHTKIQTELSKCQKRWRWHHYGKKKKKKDQ